MILDYGLKLDKEETSTEYPCIKYCCGDSAVSAVVLAGPNYCSEIFQSEFAHTCTLFTSFDSIYLVLFIYFLTMFLSSRTC